MNTKKIANISKKQQNNEKAYKSRVFCKLSKYIIILFSLIIAVATVIYSTAAVLSYNIMDSDVVLQRDRIAELEGGASTPV
ncbi:MAG: hypothetical protein LBQ27_00920, partial [Clostridiales bacterium]|nr:hypothetical protein [Clostridiales bacterium]